MTKGQLTPGEKLEEGRSRRWPPGRWRGRQEAAGKRDPGGRENLAPGENYAPALAPRGGRNRRGGRRTRLGRRTPLLGRTTLPPSPQKAGLDYLIKEADFPPRASEGWSKALVGL